MGPATHESILRTLLGRPAWVQQVLDAVEAGVILPDEIPLSDRQRLAGDDKRAARLIGKSNTAPPAEKLKRLAAAAELAGDPAGGAMVFGRLCASCHALRGSGFSVGPDISAYGRKPVADLLTAIVAPSQAIEPRFMASTVSTKDGRARAGIVREETASGLVVAQPGGLLESLLRTELKEITPLRLSLMPEGLDAVLTPQDTADLIAFIRGSAPAAFGRADAAVAERARLDFIRSGSGLLKVTREAGALPYPGWAGTRPLHFCRQSAGENLLEWEAKPDGQAATDGMVTFRFAAGMGYFSQPAGKFEFRLNGGDAMEFNVSLTDQTWRSSSGQVSMHYSVLEANAEDSCGIMVITAPAALLTAGKAVTFSVAGSDSASTRWFGVYEVE